MPGSADKHPNEGRNLPRAGSFSAERSHDSTALLLSGPVPQGKFDPVANANLIVDASQIVPDSNYADPEFSRDFSVVQSVRDQPYNASLASAELRDAVQRPLLGWQFPPRWDDRKGEPVKSWGRPRNSGSKELARRPEAASYVALPMIAPRILPEVPAKITEM